MQHQGNAIQRDLIELCERVRQAHSALAHWGLCCQALRDQGIAGIGYGLVPSVRETTNKGFLSSSFFKHTYSQEWEEAILDTYYLDDDMVLSMILSGQHEVEWFDPEAYAAATQEQKRQSDIEADLGIEFGVSLGLGRAPMSGIGLWVSHVKTQDAFQHYWAAHRAKVSQICLILDEGYNQNPAHVFVALSPREYDCLSYLAIGLRPAEICWKLKISEKTLEKHIKNAKVKLRARTRDHAVARALALNFVQP